MKVVHLSVEHGVACCCSCPFHVVAAVGWSMEQLVVVPIHSPLQRQGGTWSSLLLFLSIPCCSGRVEHGAACCCSYPFPVVAVGWNMEQLVVVPIHSLLQRQGGTWSSVEQRVVVLIHFLLQRQGGTWSSVLLFLSIPCCSGRVEHGVACCCSHPFPVVAVGWNMEQLVVVLIHSLLQRQGGTWSSVLLFLSIPCCSGRVEHGVACCCSYPFPVVAVGWNMESSVLLFLSIPCCSGWVEHGVACCCSYPFHVVAVGWNMVQRVVVPIHSLLQRQGGTWSSLLLFLSIPCCSGRVKHGVACCCSYPFHVVAVGWNMEQLVVVPIHSLLQRQGGTWSSVLLFLSIPCCSGWVEHGVACCCSYPFPVVAVGWNMEQRVVVLIHSLLQRQGGTWSSLLLFLSIPCCSGWVEHGVACCCSYLFPVVAVGWNMEQLVVVPIHSMLQRLGGTWSSLLLFLSIPCCSGRVEHGVACCCSYPFPVVAVGWNMEQLVVVPIHSMLQRQGGTWSSLLLFPSIPCCSGWVEHGVACCCSYPFPVVAVGWNMEQRVVVLIHSLLQRQDGTWSSLLLFLSIPRCSGRVEHGVACCCSHPFPVVAVGWNMEQLVVVLIHFLLQRQGGTWSSLLLFLSIPCCSGRVEHGGACCCSYPFPVVAVGWNMEQLVVVPIHSMVQRQGGTWSSLLLFLSIPCCSGRVEHGVACCCSCPFPVVAVGWNMEQRVVVPIHSLLQRQGGTWSSVLLFLSTPCCSGRVEHGVACCCSCPFPVVAVGWNMEQRVVVPIHSLLQRQGGTWSSLLLFSCPFPVVAVGWNMEQRVVVPIHSTLQRQGGTWSSVLLFLSIPCCSGSVEHGVACCCSYPFPVVAVGWNMQQLVVVPIHSLLQRQGGTWSSVLLFLSIPCCSGWVEHGVACCCSYPFPVVAVGWNMEQLVVVPIHSPLQRQGGTWSSVLLFLSVPCCSGRVEHGVACCCSYPFPVVAVGWNMEQRVVVPIHSPLQRQGGTWSSLLLFLSIPRCSGRVEHGVACCCSYPFPVVAVGWNMEQRVVVPIRSLLQWQGGTWSSLLLFLSIPCCSGRVDHGVACCCSYPFPVVAVGWNMKQRVVVPIHSPLQRQGGTWSSVLLFLSVPRCSGRVEHGVACCCSYPFHGVAVGWNMEQLVVVPIHSLLQRQGRTWSSLLLFLSIPCCSGRVEHGVACCCSYPFPVVAVGWNMEQRIVVPIHSTLQRQGGTWSSVLLFLSIPCCSGSVEHGVACCCSYPFPVVAVGWNMQQLVVVPIHSLLQRQGGTWSSVLLFLSIPCCSGWVEHGVACCCSYPFPVVAVGWNMEQLVVVPIHSLLQRQGGTWSSVLLFLSIPCCSGRVEHGVACCFSYPFPVLAVWRNMEQRVVVPIHSLLQRQGGTWSSVLLFLSIPCCSSRVEHGVACCCSYPFRVVAVGWNMEQRVVVPIHSLLQRLGGTWSSVLLFLSIPCCSGRVEHGVTCCSYPFPVVSVRWNMEQLVVVPVHSLLQRQGETWSSLLLFLSIPCCSGRVEHGVACCCSYPSPVVAVGRNTGQRFVVPIHSLLQRQGGTWSSMLLFLSVPCCSGRSEHGVACCCSYPFPGVVVVWNMEQLVVVPILSLMQRQGGTWSSVLLFLSIPCCSGRVEHGVACCCSHPFPVVAVGWNMEQRVVVPIHSLLQRWGGGDMEQRVVVPIHSLLQRQGGTWSSELLFLSIPCCSGRVEHGVACCCSYPFPVVAVGRNMEQRVVVPIRSLLYRQVGTWSSVLLFLSIPCCSGRVEHGVACCCSYPFPVVAVGWNMEQRVVVPIHSLLQRQGGTWSSLLLFISIPCCSGRVEHGVACCCSYPFPVVAVGWNMEQLVVVPIHSLLQRLGGTWSSVLLFLSIPCCSGRVGRVSHVFTVCWVTVTSLLLTFSYHSFTYHMLQQKHNGIQLLHNNHCSLELYKLYGSSIMQFPPGSTPVGSLYNI